MAKNRKKSNSASRKARSEVAYAAEVTADRSIGNSRHVVVALIGFLVFLVVYLWLFYSAPLDAMQNFEADQAAEPFNRLEYQRFLFSEPGFFWQLWTGGDTSTCNVWDRLPILGWTAFIFGTALLIGRLLMHWTGADRDLTRLEIMLFSIGVGLNVLSLFTLTIGLLGAINMPLIGYLPAVAALVGLTASRSLREKMLARGNGQQPLAKGHGDSDKGWLGAKALWFGLPFVVIILLGAMIPPRAFDVCEYHLQIPKEWYQAGQVNFVEHNIYGNMPLGAEMHALLGMILTGDWWLGALVGKTVIAMFAPLTALTIFSVGRRLVNATAGAIGALVYISIPWIALVSMQGLIEGVFAYYFFASVAAVMIWSRRKTAAEQGAAQPGGGHLLLAGFLAGAAVACKYPAILFVVVPMCVCVLFESKWTQRTTNDVSNEHDGDSRPSFQWRAATVFLLAVIGGGGLWLAKNWVLAESPTYPLMYEVFGGRALTAEKHDQWNRAHALPKDQNGASYSVALLLNDLAGVIWKSNWLSPLMVPLAACTFLINRHRRWIVVLWCIIFFVIAAWWSLTHRIDRFWIPVLPIAALLAGVGATWTKIRIWQHVVIGMLCWGLACNFQIITSKAMNDVRFFVSLDELRRDPYRTKAPIKSRMHPGHRFLNEYLPEGHKALMVGNAEPFDLEVPVLYNTCFDDCQFTRLLQGKTKAQRVRSLKDEQIGLIFVDWRELSRYRAPGGYGYSSDYVQVGVLKKLVADGVLGTPLPAFPPSGDPPPHQIFSVPSSGFTVKARQ